MWRLVALLLLLGACGPGPFREPVWVPESHPLHAAQQSWGLPLPYTPELNESYTAAELPAVCEEPWKETLDGCARVVEGEVWVASDLSPERRAVALAHELGHVIAFWYAGPELRLERSVRHIPREICKVSPSVMCQAGAESPQPTPEDFDFVLGM